jgi:hypothetical protein
MNYFYVFNKDNSFSQRVVNRYFKNRMPHLFRSIRGVDIYYYSFKGSLVKQEEFYKRRLSSVNFYTDGKMDSTKTFYKEKLSTVQKYSNENVVLTLNFSQTGDTIHLEEYSFNEYNLLVKERNLTKVIDNDSVGKVIGVRREETVVECLYTFY